MSFTVLICDDSKVARNMMKKSLPDNFASEIHLAENGVQALNQLKEHPITLLLLDLTMPVMGGLQVLQEIKRQCIEVFVVVISGDVQPQIREKAMALGAIDFIDKPLEQAKLNTVLARFGLY